MRPLRFRITRLEDRLTPAIATWDGGGTDNKWMTAANWVGDVAPNPGDDLLFPDAALRANPLNDFAAGTAFGQIHITGGNYFLTGNRINLGGGIRIEVPGQHGNLVVANLEMPLTLTNDQMISGDFDSPFAIDGPIDQNGFSLQIDVAAFAANSRISGVVSGLGGLTKTGSGVLDFWADSTPQFLFIEGGTVQVTGSLMCPVSVANNSLLIGGGAVGDVTVNNASVEPRVQGAEFAQTGPTTLTTGTLNSFSTAHYSFQITDTARSRLDVHGSVSLDGTLFIASQFSQYPFHVGDVFTIIQNDGTDPVVGNFLNSPEGAIVMQGAIPLRISYHGGDGNDVTLTAVSQTAFAVAAGTGGGPIVNVYNVDGGLVRSFMAYEPGFHGGVHVTVADVTGDLVPDVITAPGPGGGPVVRIWDGATGAMVRQFAAYDPNFRGGVWLATARLVNNAPIDIITGAGPGGGPHVRVFNATTAAPVGEFMAFDPNFRGGVTVAATDGQPIHFGFIPGQIIVGAGAGGGPVVRVFTGPNGPMTGQFLAYDPAFRGGVNVAVGSFVGGNDIVTAPMSSGGPHVRFFAGQPNGSIQVGQLEKEFLAYAGSFTGGVTITTHLLDPFFPPTLITGPGPGGGPHVEEWSFANNTFTVTKNLIAFDPTFTGGVFVG